MSAINGFGTYQVSLSNTATRIAPLRQSRETLTITKLGSQDLYLGCNSGVSTSNGHLVGGTCGSAISIPTTSEVWGILATGSLTVTVAETYN